MDYFLRVHDTTPTRLWVNDPTPSVTTARDHGAVACTGLVGGPEHIAINHCAIDEILAEDPPVETAIERPVPAAALKALNTFDDFRRAMADDGLQVGEFEGFGPVQHFRNAFIVGWTTLCEAIAKERSRQVAIPTP